MPKEKIRKKRQYSRNGCQECKRRKLKCDEGKPACWQCSHLGKTCVYLKVIKFSDSRNVVLDPHSVGKQSELDTPSSNGDSPVTSTAHANSSKEPKQKKSPQDTSIYYNVIDFSSTPQPTSSKRASSKEAMDDEAQPKIEEQPLNDFTHGLSRPQLLQPIQHISPPDERRQYIINEASSLAHDIIESMHPTFDDFLIDLTESGYVKKQDVLASFNLSEPHKSYLELFYDKISAWLMPLEQQLCNEILLLHAKTSPYLLAAMLSLAAQDDEKSRYIATCLKSLSEVFQDGSKILNNIEPLMLTILLLGSDSSSGNWRAHLRGAKDLFTKYIRFYNTTPSLLFAKSWFAAIEILAGLQGVGTGKAHELDELLDVGLYGANSSQGVEVGLLLSNGYNMFLGYSTEAIVMYREFIKLRARPDVGNKDILFLMSLVHSAKEFQVASTSVKIERDNPAHPDYGAEKDDKVIFPWSCYGFKGEEVYSWYDLIHQLHVDALLLHIYNELYQLDKTHVLCQALVFEMLEICFFFDGEVVLDGADSRLLMLQGPMLACGLNCLEDDHKTMVVNYFQSLIDGGVQSAKSSYKKVMNSWEGTNSDELDLVPFA